MNVHRRLSARIALVAVAIVAAGRCAARADDELRFTDRLDRTRPEAWAMRWFGSAALPTGFGGEEKLAPWALDFGLEAGSIPSLSASERTVGFDGTKTEDLNRSPVLARPRIRLGLPGGFWAGAAWVPPLELKGVRSSVPSIELGRDLWGGDRFRLALSLSATDGRIRGDITCPASAAAAGDDPIRNPYGCESPSNDTIALRAYGAEVTAAWRASAQSRWELYAALEPHYFDSHFQVDANYAGLDDYTRLVYHGWDTSASLGATFHASENWRASGEIFWAPLRVRRGPPDTGHLTNDDLVNLRLLVAYRLR